jgi:hypothetical protein
MRLAVALTAALLTLTGTAQAAGPPLGADGETAPTYDYASAIRQRALVQTDVDQDGNGVNDKLVVDIIRPNAPGTFPAIVDASPYYTSLCRGLNGECMASAVAATVRITGAKKAVRLTAGTARTVALDAKAGRVRLTLVTTAGAPSAPTA